MKQPDQVLAPVSLDDLHLFSQGSGDPNRIHLDPEFARTMGLPGAIAHGMLISGFLAERALVLRDAARPAYHLKHWQIRFRAMTLVGDILTLTADAEDASGVWSLEMSARNQRGETVATASARFTTG